MQKVSLVVLEDCRNYSHGLGSHVQTAPTNLLLLWNTMTWNCWNEQVENKKMSDYIKVRFSVGKGIGSLLKCCGKNPLNIKRKNNVSITIIYSLKIWVCMPSGSRVISLF